MELPGHLGRSGPEIEHQFHLDVPRKLQDLRIQYHPDLAYRQGARASWFYACSAQEPGPLIEPMLCRDLLRSDPPFVADSEKFVSGQKANAHILQTGSEFGSLRAGRSVKGQARARRSGSRVTKRR
jgi:hypothetical protein